MDETPVDDLPDVGDISLIDEPTAPSSEAPTTAEPVAPQTEETKEELTTEEPSEGQQQPGEQPNAETDDEAARRAHNEQMARQRIQERQRTRNAVAQQIDQAYGPKSEQELVEQGYSEQQAQIEALRQEMQYRDQRNQIAELNAGMQVEAVSVVNDMPVFNPNSPEYDPDFTQFVEQQYKQVANLQLDDNGIIVNANVPLYDYYQQMYDVRQQLISKGQQQGQSQYQEMLSRTENPGGSASAGQGDSLDDLEARLGDIAIT